MFGSTQVALEQACALLSSVQVTPGHTCVVFLSAQASVSRALGLAQKHLSILGLASEPPRLQKQKDFIKIRGADLPTETESWKHASPTLVAFVSS